MRQRATGAQPQRGACICPDDVDRAGHRCAGRSAYSRPGGAEPVCGSMKAEDRLTGTANDGGSSK
jgi:hypothetical protein